MKAKLDQGKIASTGHSSTLEITLRVGSATFPVLQSSETAIKLNDSQLVPQGDGVLEIVVDGRPHCWPIRVLGESPRPKWIAIADRPGDGRNSGA